MAAYTDNLELVMPTSTDFVNIEDINSNMETIDEAFGDISGKIGATDDEAGSASTGTVMGKLNKVLEGGSNKTWTTHKLIITEVGQYTVQGRINLRGMYSHYWGYKIYVNGELMYTQSCYSNTPRRPSMKDQFSTSCSYEHSYPDMLNDFYVDGTIIFDATEISSNSSYAAEAKLVFTYDLWE